MDDLNAEGVKRLYTELSEVLERSRHYRNFPLGVELAVMMISIRSRYDLSKGTLRDDSDNI